MRNRYGLDFDWRFALGDFPGAERPDFDDSSWRVVDLPHDWSIEGTPHPDHPSGAAGGFFPGGIGWYRKRLRIPEDLGDRHLLVEFDGVYMNSRVWCNGRLCGERPYGYSSFAYDVTPLVRPRQQACLAVRVDNSRQKNSRWYTGSGIYRHVWLTLAGPIRVAHWGTYVTTPEVSSEKAVVQCAVTLVNDSSTREDVEVHGWILEANPVARARVRCRCEKGETSTVTLRLELRRPRRWAPNTPHLYTLRTELRRDVTVLDSYDTRFGVRSLRFDPHEGFFLNGRPLKFRGVNEHHDAGCVGAAVPDDMIRRRLQILKRMGCNAIRLAHNPTAPIYLDLCDEMGFLVIEEAFDEWKEGKTPFGYHLYWDTWWERDLTDMIRRDRNHPCLVLWSVGNEIREVREGRPEGRALLQALREVCHREDPTRPMTCGCCNTRITLAAGYGSLMDVVGYNGGGGSCFDYEKDHAAYPDMIQVATEHPHTLQTRGVYRTRTWYRDLARHQGPVRWYPSPRLGEDGRRRMPPSLPRTGGPVLELMHVPDLTEEELFPHFDPHYQSSYGNAIVRMSIQDAWYRTRELPFVCGEFRWTGFDYLGECYAWPCKSWNFGVIDLAGFPKDAYFFYQSQWTETPMVHMLPHWTWPGYEGRTIPVLVYTNCEQVELWLNGVSLGRQNMDPRVMELRWDVSYRPGVLQAVGYRGGVAAATCVRETSAEPAAIRLVSEEAVLRADRTSVAHVVATVVDQAGRFVPFAGPDITVEVEGPARLIGLENGDPLDTTNYRLTHRRAFHGLLLAVVQALDRPGTVTVRAGAEGLEPGEVMIEAVQPTSSLGDQERPRGDMPAGLADGQTGPD